MAEKQRQSRRPVYPGRGPQRHIDDAAGGDGVLARHAQTHAGETSSPAIAAIRPDPSTAAASALSRRVQRKASQPRPADRKTAPGTSGTAFDRAVSGSAKEVPYRDRMEAAFGTDFSDVTAHVGDRPAKEGLAEMSAEAAARGDHVAFRDATPSPETVAHELAHVVQQRPAEPSAPARRSVGGADTASPAAAEREADAAGLDVAAGRPARIAPTPAATAPIRMKGAPRKAPLEALDELLGATPLDPVVVGATVGKLGRKDRTTLRDDPERMSRVVDAYKAGSLDVLDLATRLDATLLATIQWLRKASQEANLAGAAFGKRFQKASAAQVREVAASPDDIAAMITNAPDLGPLQAKAISKSGAEIAATLKDPALLDWAMKSADGLDVLAVLLPKAGKKTLKTDTAALEAVLGYPGTIDQDAVPLLKAVGLTPPQAVPRLAGAGAHARMAAATFPDWFLQDTKSKDLYTFVDSADLDALKTAAPTEVPPLSVQVVTAANALGKILHDRRAFQDWVTGTQGWAPLLQAITTNAAGGLLKALTKSGGNWTALLADIRTQRETGEGDPARAALDALFAATPSSNMELMKQLFEARFGVQVGTGDDAAAKERLKGTQVKEKDFGPKGLRHIYDSFKVLPPSQAEAGLLTLMTRHSEKGSSSMSGFAYNASPHLSLQYGEGDTEKTEKGAYTSDGDKMRGMNMLDTTAVHELGHKVDVGHKYSGKATFLALATWKEHARGIALVRTMQANMTSPLGNEAGLSANDKSILVWTAAQALVNRRTSEDDTYDDMVSAYAAYGKAQEPGPKDTHQDILDLWDHALTTNLLKHVAAGHEKSGAWWREPFAYLPNLQYHEGYGHEPGWWSYPVASRAGKLSIYQFRNPADHFAELYATYWCSRPFGSRVPAAMKKWFEDEGLTR